MMMFIILEILFYNCSMVCMCVLCALRLCRAFDHRKDFEPCMRVQQTQKEWDVKLLHSITRIPIARWTMYQGFHVRATNGIEYTTK